jgi:maltose alpha-D-glucosyltransferase/alpha-amylase
MRLNVGIRRRLAPLMENSRRRIELMNSLLFTMPGTPVLYYGDEIGMGDNVYLGDRNGVRTPMQWSSDRNAGFSRADPARLYFPVIMDPVYGYESINVEAQERSPFSLLQWMKRMIALRRQHPVFGRGSIQFISTDNRKVLTYVRKFEQEVILCVANLSRTVQPVEIPLAEFAGLTPVEMIGQTPFPRVGDQPYFLTLPAYGFYQFSLQEVVQQVAARTLGPPEEPADVPAIFAGVVWDSLMDGSLRTIIERQALGSFLQRQRWFGAKARPLAAVRFTDWVTLRRGPHPAFLTIVDVQYRDGGRDRYVLPFALTSGADAVALEQQYPLAVVARISGARKGLLIDGLFDDEVCTTLRSISEHAGQLSMRYGRLEGASFPWIPDGDHPDTPLARTAPDQSNTSVYFGKRLIMKLFRRLEPGVNPDVEIGAHLSAARTFTRAPQLVGATTYHREHDEPASLAMLQAYVFNQGNGWQVAIEELGRYFERVTALPLPPDGGDEASESLLTLEAIGPYLAVAEVIGRRTGDLHASLGTSTSDPAFAPVPFTRADLDAAAAAMRARGERQFAALDTALPGLDPSCADLARQVLARRDDTLRAIAALRDVRSAGLRIRVHGDYHLGQVLETEGDIVILDFEGEPARPLAERREKYSPLRDVAGMLRSFSYAALTALNVAIKARPEDRDKLAPWADFWERGVSAAFLRAYFAAVDGHGLLPSGNDLDTLLDGFVTDKALYELGYELNNRPEWVHVPLAALLRLRSSQHA